MDAIINAIYKKDVVGLKKIFGMGANVNTKDELGRTPLMHAVLDDEASMEIVQLLLNLGADVNSYDDDQHWTTLHFAARDQKFEMVDMLLSNGAIVDAKDIFGNTPLWRCVMNGKPQGKIVLRLLQAGANPDMKNLRGVSPKDIACKTAQSEILKILLT